MTLNISTINISEVIRRLELQPGAVFDESSLSMLLKDMWSDDHYAHIGVNYQWSNHPPAGLLELFDQVHGVLKDLGYTFKPNLFNNNLNGLYRGPRPQYTFKAMGTWPPIFYVQRI